MKKNNLFLLLLALGLVVAAYFILNQAGEKGKSISERELFFNIDSAQIDKFELYSDFGEIVLEKGTGGWKLVKPLEFLPDTGRIRRALSLFSHMYIINTASTNPAKQLLYGVDSTGTRAKVYARNKLVADFIIGKNGANPRETFVRKNNSNKVLLVDGPMAFIIKAPDKDWRDRAIISIPESSVKDVSMMAEGDNFELKLSGTEWKIDGKAVNQGIAGSFIRSLSGFTADFFQDSLYSPFPKINFHIKVNDWDLLVSELDKERYLMQTNKSSQQYIVMKWKALSILKTRQDFLQSDKNP